MNSKAFRRNQPKSASSTFISLHFNKSDEEQIEISYKKGGDVLSSNSNFYVEDCKRDVKGAGIDSVVEEDCTSPGHVTDSQSSLETKLEPNAGDDVVDFPSNLDLSPAIEAAEVADSDTFHRDINSKLEKAKCEILDWKKDMPSSFSEPEKCTQNPFSPAEDFKSDDRPDEVPPDKGGSSLPFIFQSGIRLMRYARNNVKFHLLVATLAFLCAPVPSWLSGFLVGSLLASSLVYWLYKPQRNRKNLYCVSPSIAYASHFQEETAGILKGWMNELPSSFGSYSPERYHVSCTRSVYVRLEGSYLRISFPAKNIPRRAMFNEPRYEMQFVHQQHYDVTDATVQLLPQGLNRKRLWSKKYPICLRIPNHKGAVLSPANGAKKDKFVPRIEENNEISIYLFARTDRDKSLWFSRFVQASKAQADRPHSPTLSMGRAVAEQSFENKRTLSVDFAQLQSTLSEEGGDEDTLEGEESFVKLNLSKQQRFEMYMATLLAPLHPSLATRNKEQAASLTWLNVLIGRLFFDFLVEDVWAQLVSDKIQKKLNRIKLPFFLSELTVRDIQLGSALPRIHHASDPCVDERGVWVDVDVSYSGSFHMTLETKLNLHRFKGDSETLLLSGQLDTSRASVLCESDEDSLESSSEDECPSPNAANQDSLREGTRGKRLMKLVDKLAQSSYFQQAAKNRYVKRAMDDLSNTPLVLTVEVQWLTGTLAINFPPWPTDRLWYGFRGNPSLSLTARPKLGQHVVTFTHVTEWIEKKLTSEFQKVLVLPNMDDLIIPIMQAPPSLDDAS